MKKILFLLFISLVLISCWYESDYMGAIILPDGTNSSMYVMFVKRNNTNDISDTIIANYKFELTEKRQKPILLEYIHYIDNWTNLNKKNSLKTIKPEDKYLNIEVSITSNDIYIKDWDNEEHYLKSTTNTNSWIVVLYTALLGYGFINADS